MFPVDGRQTLEASTYITSQHCSNYCSDLHDQFHTCTCCSLSEVVEMEHSPPPPYLFFSQLDLLAGHLQHTVVTFIAKPIHCKEVVTVSPVTCTLLGFWFEWKDLDM